MADIESRDEGLPVSAGQGALRASHEDRDKVAEVLRMAAGDGRLDADELDERLERALTAKTYSELEVLTADLPAAPGTGVVPGSAVAGGGARAKDLARIQVTSGTARRDNRWIVPKELEAVVGSGSVRLDFTQAVITQPTLRVTAEVRSGSLTLITRPGIVVDADDVHVRSGNVRVKEPWGHDVPVTLRVEISGTVRSGNITARPPRRSFWEWLRRAPRRYEIAA